MADATVADAAGGQMSDAQADDSGSLDGGLGDAALGDAGPGADLPVLVPEVEGAEGNGQRYSVSAVRFSQAVEPRVPAPDVPTPTVEVVEGAVSVRWDDCQAASYRVLVMRDGVPPRELTTTALEVSFPEGAIFGWQWFIVEAIDELGNSRFSAPVQLEVM